MKLDPPSVPAPEAMPFRVRLCTRWSDEDLQGVLNNAVYATLLEEARLAWCAGGGLLVEGAFPFVLAQMNLRFLSPGRGGAEVLVQLATVHVGTRSFVQVYRVVDAEHGAVWCEAQALLVGWDAGARASCALSPELRAALEGSAPRR